MPVIYPSAVRVARMTAVATAAAGNWQCGGN